MSQAFRAERKRRRRDEDSETKNVRNRIRRGKLPRFTSSKTKRVSARGRTLGGHFERRVEYVA